MVSSKFQRFLAFSIPAAVLLLVVASVAVAAGGDPQKPDAGALDTNPLYRSYTAGPTTYTGVVTYDSPLTTSSTTFVSLPGSRIMVPVAPGQTALISARFTTESRCSETGGAGENNWCEIRIIIGCCEGYPQSSQGPDSFAFDSTNDGADGIGSWEGHAADRHRCVFNSGNAAITVPVYVQWRVTNNANDADLPEFWLDDWSLTAQRADGCSPIA